MWSRIAEEMAIPWRAAEAMHWQMGENEMARRAGVTPFTLANTNNNGSAPAHSMNLPRHYNAHIQIPPSMISASQHHRRNSNPNSLSHSLSHGHSQPGQPPQLPSLSELTAGLPAFAPSHHVQQAHSAVDAHSPYAEYPSRRSLPPSGLPSSGTAFDHLQPPGSLAGYPRPGSPAACGTGMPLTSGYFPTSTPLGAEREREVNGRRY
jgi:hypothetical protein